MMVNEEWFRLLCSKDSSDDVNYHLRSLFLQSLASSKCFSFQSEKFFNERHGSTGSMSWEELLKSFIENKTTVTEDGQLKVVPVFMVVPTHVQTRLLFLLVQQHHRVCATSLTQFVKQVKQHIKRSSWTEHLIKKLENILPNSSKSSVDDPRKTPADPYKFHDQDRLSSLLEKLKSKHKPSDQIAVSNGLKACDAETDEQGSSSCFGQNEHAVDREKDPGKFNEKEKSVSKNIVNVIVIDDDEEDAILVSSQPFEENKNQTKINPVKENKKRLISDIEEGCDFESNISSKRQKIADHEKNKSPAVSDSNREIETKEISALPISDKDNNLTNPYMLANDSSRGDEELSEEDKVLLGAWRETFLMQEAQDPSFFSSVQKHLQSLSPQQVKTACDFLGLKELSDEFLNSLCEATDWTTLSYDTSVILIETFFIDRVMRLSSEPSLSLVTAAKSVAQCHASVLLDVLTGVFCLTDSGPHQCQLMISLCDNCMTPELADSLISQVCSKDVKINENIVGVLQAVVDRRPDFELEGLQRFLRLLNHSNISCGSSSKFGKLVLAFSNKYGKKLTGDQLNSLSVIVGEHKSSHKRALMAALKRISK